MMIDGEGGDRGRVGSLSESSSTIGGSGCMTLRDVGVRKLSSPTIRGRRKKDLNRSLTASLELGGDPMSERCPALNPSGVEPFVTMSMRGWVYSPAPLNWSQKYRSISQGGRMGPRSHHSAVRSTLELGLSSVALI
jgi:hypothetical protein